MATVTTWAHGDLAQRIAALTVQIDTPDPDGAVLLKRADLYFEHGDWAAALSDYARAETLGVDRSSLLFYLGRTHQAAGDYARALVLLNERLRIAQDDQAARLVRARNPLMPPGVAAADVERVLRRVHSPSPDAFLLHAKLVAKAHPKLCTPVAHSVRQSIEMAGPLITLVDFGTSTCSTRGDTKEALELIALLPKSLRNTAKWRVRAADVLFESGDHAGATRFYKGARQHLLSLSPGKRNVPARRALAQHIDAQLARLRSAAPLSTE